MQNQEPEVDVEATDKAGGYSDIRGSEEVEEEHVTGLKLVILLSGIGLTVFLMALDVSVVATVCHSSPCCLTQTRMPRTSKLWAQPTDPSHRQYHPSRLDSIPPPT